MSAIANSFLSAASVCAFPAARGTRRSAPHRAAPVFVRASADDDAIADRSPLAQLGAASKKLGIGILAAAVVATNASLALWAVAGLETASFTLLLLLLVWRFEVEMDAPERRPPRRGAGRARRAGRP